jgi:3-ketosteroid 9alpha-monooxygenase subunit A
MVQRFEFEIDTAHAVQAWEYEVQQNLARRRDNHAHNDPDNDADNDAEQRGAQAGAGVG